MLAKLRRSFIAFSVSVMAMMGLMTFLAPVTEVSAAKCPANSGFLSFPNWYRGLQCDSKGQVILPQGTNLGDDVVWPIVLNATDILLQVAGMVAGLFIIINGIMYMTARGVPENSAKARKGLMQAAAGLGLAILASTIVGFVVARLGATDGVIPTLQAADLIGGALNLLWWIVGVVCVVMILWSSFQYLTSKGFEDKALTARRTLLDAVIGLALTLLAAFITNLIISIVAGN